MLCVFLVGSVTSALGQSQSETVARAYMAAYSRADWDAMVPFMAEDYVLIDKTNPDPTFVSEYRGVEATLKMLKAFGKDQGVIELGFEFPTVFESNDVVVFSGYVNTYAAPPGLTYAYKWRAEQVTALSVKNGKITQHVDYANYKGAKTTVLPRP